MIECFERYGVDSEIKDQNDGFFYLSDLIPRYLNSPKWNASRNIRKSLTSVKKYGDLSAHNRRYLAKKNDIDSFKTELRQAVQEIILTADYPIGREIEQDETHNVTSHYVYNTKLKNSNLSSNINC